MTEASTSLTESLASNYGFLKALEGQLSDEPG